MSSSSQLDQLVNKEDPTQLFHLVEELAEGSFGTVYKVYSNSHYSAV